MNSLRTRCLVALLSLVAIPLAAQQTNTFTIAAYNLENWLLMDRAGKPDQPKPAEQKEAVCRVLGAIRPDVLGVCEMGSTNDFAEFANALKERGLDYPSREWIEGANKDRHVALLSRFPIVDRQSRTDYGYRLEGKPMRIERGILDVRIKVNDGYSFRAVMAHLKSKRTTAVGDQALMRLEEARLLRRHIDGALEKEPRLNLIVMGDLNDTPDSEAVRTVIGAGPSRLLDLMPVSSKGYHDTYYWSWRREYSRVDYLLASPGMSNELVAGSARIADVAGHSKASDHRAIYAQFYNHEIGQSATQPSVQPAMQTTAQPAAQPAAQPQTAWSSSHQILIGIIVFDTAIIIGLVIVLVRWRKSHPRSRVS